jgi:hypothetical protein
MSLISSKKTLRIYQNFVVKKPKPVRPEFGEGIIYAVTLQKNGGFKQTAAIVYRFSICFGFLKFIFKM